MDSKKSLAAALGAATGLAAARVVDLALIGASVFTAASAVGFAGYMTLTGVGKPMIFGMDHLAIFAQPSHPHRAEAAKFGPPDTNPIGALPHDKDHVSGYTLVGAQARFAWLREGNRIFAVRPGEEVPRLGRVAAIEQREGRWTLVDEKGAAMIVSALVDIMPTGGVRFGKKMIFGDDAPR
ncbi:MAG: hypothetical protein KGM15_09260 [Pseudomonadota bacterium]|nr:hypothetical protein [Pseudomonadota bacterium]